MIPIMLFVCETQAQILNALNIKCNLYREINADICISNNIHNADEISERIKKKFLFSNVYIYKPYISKDQSIKAKIIKILDGFKMLKYVEEVLPNRDKVYDLIFLGGPSIFTQGIYYYFKNKYIDTELAMYEEGIFEYYMFEYKKNFTRRIYSKLVYGCFYIEDCKKIFVYRSDMILSKPDAVEAIRIPALCNVSEEFRNILNYIFIFKKDGLEDFQNCEYVYIEQAFPSRKENELQRKIIEIIISQVSKQKFLIKLHPFSAEDKYEDMNVKCLKSSFSMELICMNFMKKEITFFTIYSSAVFNCNLVLGKFPKIVLLYRIFDTMILDKNIFSFIENFMKIYPKELMFIPNNINEISDKIFIEKFEGNID